jgi:DNA-binding NarL/FixJ family response regulator
MQAHDRVDAQTISCDAVCFHCGRALPGAVGAAMSGYVLDRLGPQPIYVHPECSVAVARNVLTLALSGTPAQPTPREISGTRKERRRAGLTSAEREVLPLLVAGLTNAEIGQELGYSAHTIKHRVAAILDKLDARNRAEAAVRAVELDLVAWSRV